MSVAYYALVKLSDHRGRAATDTREGAWFPVHDVSSLAFDQAEILGEALVRLRGKLGYQPIGFEFLPKKFALLQGALVDPPIMEGRFLVGMGVAKRADHRLDRSLVTDHLDSNLLDPLERVPLADEGLTALHGPELSCSENLPGTSAVVANSTGTRFEERLLDLFDMGLGDVEAE